MAIHVTLAKIIFMGAAVCQVSAQSENSCKAHESDDAVEELSNAYRAHLKNST